jgi:hypothetical protein
MDFTSEEVRQLAARVKDASQARRLLAIAAVLDGASREDAAKRLGLGQVLTNSVLSIFAGDEIDAAMDDDRAKSLGDCVHSLAGKIAQVILVTHKSQADADWSIGLG